MVIESMNISAARQQESDSIGTPVHGSGDQSIVAYAYAVLQQECHDIGMTICSDFVQKIVLEMMRDNTALQQKGDSVGVSVSRSVDQGIVMHVMYVRDLPYQSGDFLRIPCAGGDEKRIFFFVFFDLLSLLERMHDLLIARHEIRRCGGWALFFVKTGGAGGSQQAVDADRNAGLGLMQRIGGKDFFKPRRQRFVLRAQLRERGMRQPDGKRRGQRGTCGVRQGRLRRQ